uniref:Protein kinase domain-containing protein n=1 Tax=Elaeophora elaphi TaxID=1147741 RepID=A0A0R3S6Y1_9BILA
MRSLSKLSFHHFAYSSTGQHRISQLTHAWIFGISLKVKSMQKNKEETALGNAKKLLFSSGQQINKHFNLNQLISSGGFGQVYSGTNINTGELVAIKAESTNAKIPLLRIEANCLEALNQTMRQNFRNPPKEPIPNYYGYGEIQNVRYMVRQRRFFRILLIPNLLDHTSSVW